MDNRQYIEDQQLNDCITDIMQLLQDWKLRDLEKEIVILMVYHYLMGAKQAKMMKTSTLGLANLAKGILNRDDSN